MTRGRRDGLAGKSPAVPGDLGLTPKTHIVAHQQSVTLVSGDMTPSSGLLRHQAQTNMQPKHSYVENNYKQI